VNALYVVSEPIHLFRFSLNNTFSESGGDQRHAYRERTVAWYRKSFSLPSDWAGSAFHVRFEGVMHFAQVWLNGQYLGHHSATYDAFTVRLDNVSSVAVGGANVLAVRADGGYGSEHW
jgi:beta-galactosidase